jgi:hypothetical protein
MKQIKKILLGSLIIALLSLSVTVIDMSCTKSAAASPVGITGTNTGKLLFTTGESTAHTIAMVITDYNGNTLDSITSATFADSLAFANTLSNGGSLVSASLSPDGNFLFFSATNGSGDPAYYGTGLYKYDLNARTCTVVRRGSSGINDYLNGAY